ncbi:low molecular weight protein-tyrosine-phosphatase [Alkalilimnicola sp. S0819]|uniref:low molecular weight protein-tyrosine-phosphatase n=1 Tax=Alkalilimnicola sp. S0819 TaxID=2613922 RepID=UPI001261A6E7|nr:low molecular weight protein-tyrosine-phosphatase [Alkalilimnicola sp. S0819]KAB7627626.1 low molecular weight phosphotyrosine protein phosphatase [Alkalilimnicola sp. S0819]MPQ15789.1 low molecular weight phosphotyrosine protein phosphatase [Alkalilimnicola sp. S0819]
MTSSVLFVCLGNICRSPSAHGVFRELVREAGLTERVLMDSAGTADWHQGKAPDPRSIVAAAARGIDIADLRARQVTNEDFVRFDRILAMDEQNLADLRARCPEAHQHKLGLFLELTPDSPVREVPDPYYGGDQGFQQVLDLIEAASRSLLEALRQKD